MKLLITGVAGFIGFSLSQALENNDFYDIIGIDNLNDYYDVSLKMSRLGILKKNKNFNFVQIDICDKEKLFNLFKDHEFDVVINLAAQAGVRYSITNPYSYIDSNIVGFLNVLEGCRHYPVKHLIYASSSSVYGGNTNVPFSTDDNVDHPVSLYAATKKSNELMAHSYSNLYKIPTTGLRFFTVYGPYGRPDMAYFSFVKNIFEGKEIQIFNKGNMSRDFTYVDDIVAGIIKLIPKPPKINVDWKKNPLVSSSWAPYKIYNIGNNQPIKLLDFVETIEKYTKIEANKVFVEMQIGDVKNTFADIDDLKDNINFTPNTTIDEGIKKFVEWYKKYYYV